MRSFLPHQSVPRRGREFFFQFSNPTASCAAQEEHENKKLLPYASSQASIKIFRINQDTPFITVAAHQNSRASPQKSRAIRSGAHIAGWAQSARTFKDELRYLCDSRFEIADA